MSTVSFTPEYIERLRAEREEMLETLRNAYKIVGPRAVTNRADTEIVHAAEIIGNTLAKYYNPRS
jgi:hypothetical protein